MENDEMNGFNYDMITSDIPDHRLLDDFCRNCPICSSVVRPFFVNYNEKTVICENLDCPYPFMLDMKYVKEDNELASSDEVASYRSRPSGWSQGTASIMSAAEWSEIEKLNRAFEADENYHANSPKKHDTEALETRVKIKENEEQIKENIEKIKQLNKKLFESGEDFDFIRNEKWIKNFYRIQETQGVQLLKQQELAKLRLDKEEISNRELKINIDSEKSVQIEISNKQDEANTEHRSKK